MTSFARGTVQLSICAPCYNEEEVIDEFVRRAEAAARLVTEHYEIILVDDGSRDRTWSLIQALSKGSDRIIGVRLMRNQGHQAAASAALSIARGARVLLIDADLQDPPELLSDMNALMDRMDADVVYGQRVSRLAETWFKKSTASAFYRTLTMLTSVPIPRDTGDFRLMTRHVVEALGAMPERQRFVRGMVSWIGGTQLPLHYDRQARFAGVSKYPVSKMVRFAVDAITSFSATPLRFATYLGFGAALLSLLMLVYTLTRWFAGGTVVGWSSVMTVIVLFSAVQLIVLGILGEYVGRLFQEVKGRPIFLVGQIVVSGRSKRLPVDFSSLPLAHKRREVRKALDEASGRLD